MWTHRTGGGLWNCRLSRKNKRPAVGAYRWAGGERQLEGSPIYGTAKCWAVDSKKADCPSKLLWPFDLNTAPPTFSITIFYPCIKYIIQACPFFFFLTSNTAAMSHAVRNEDGRRVFLWFTAWYNKLRLFFFGPLAKEIAWSQSSKSTAQPSGLWISLNTGHSSLSCMWIFSLLQFQIN